MNELLPTAKRITRRLPGLIWAIPAAALIIAGYLGIDAFLERGIEVVVTFEDAAGAKTRDTQVTYKGVVIGRVTKIDIADDHEHVEITLRLARRIEPLLTTGTQFWLVGAKPTITDLSSLAAAVTGLSIEMAPGPGEPATHFGGLDRAPIIDPGTPGKRILLETDDRDSLQPGSRVAYKGGDAGKITDIRFDPPRGFIVEAFIYEPFTSVLRGDSSFWVSGGVQISLTAQGVSTTLPAASDLLVGGIAFDTPAASLESDEAAEGEMFKLYADESGAHDGADGVGVSYETSFEGAGGVLPEGAPVNLMGFRIGRVRSHRLQVDRESGGVLSPVVVAIFPRRLGFEEGGREVTDGFMSTLLARGYRLRVIQSPPIVGSLALELVKTSDKGKLEPGNDYPRLPTTSTGDIGTLEASAASILAKIDAVPIRDIGERLGSSLERLNRTLAAVEPELQPLLREMRGSAAAIKGTAVQARAVMTGEGAEQNSSVPEAMRELTEAARALRNLADTLEQHPESLLFGKGKGDR